MCTIKSPNPPLLISIQNMYFYVYDKKYRGKKCCLTFTSGKSCLLLISVVGFSEKIKSFAY